MNHPQYPAPADRVFVETTSYDTISNAFFTRTTMTDIHATNVDNARDGEMKTEKSWRNILVVTNEFHIHRTKAIFDWIFGASSFLRIHRIRDVLSVM